MSYPVLVALAMLGGAYAASAVGMLTARQARASGVALGICGLAVLAGAVFDGTGDASRARLSLVAAGALLFPVALMSYPRPRWRHPVDFVAGVTVVGAGMVAIIWIYSTPVLGTLGLIIGCTVLAHLWWRFEQEGTADRGALIWVSLAASVAGLVLFLATFLQLGSVGAAVGVLFLAAVGPAMYVGVSRPEVIDIRGVVVRVVVVFTAMVGYLSLYMGAASLLQILGDPAPPVATLAVLGAVVATTFHPMQVVLRGVIDELLFGARPDPLDAAARVVGHIGADSELALRTIRESLVLPYAALDIDGETVAESGQLVTHTRRLALALGPDHVGHLVVGLRAGDLSLSTDDEHVLGLVAPLLAQTQIVSRLAADLQASRGQAVAAIEEERRRLRRDLHDGLGPRLSGIAFTSDAVRNTLRADPDAAEQLLSALRKETVTAIEDIRQLVYAMRPPALDELGLIPALRQQVQALRTPQGLPMRVDLTPDDLLPVPAAVEVAAYRIVGEALTNAARHSGSTTASVHLTLDERCLVIEVRDAGRRATQWHAGVGLASMRERAAELGGTMSAEPETSGGGCVRAVLPLPNP